MKMKKIKVEIIIKTRNTKRNNAKKVERIEYRKKKLKKEMEKLTIEETNQ